MKAAKNNMNFQETEATNKDTKWNLTKSHPGTSQKAASTLPTSTTPEGINITQWNISRQGLGKKKFK